MSEFGKKTMEILGKGAEATKGALSKAGKAARQTAEKGKNQVEILQLEGKVKKAKLQIGEIVCGAAADCEVDFDSIRGEVSEALAQIASLEKEISERKNREF